MKTEAKTYPEFSKEAIAKRAAFQRHAGRCHPDLVAALEALIIASVKAENAIQKVASITDETRLGWALTALDSALPIARAALASAKEVEAWK